MTLYRVTANGTNAKGQRRTVAVEIEADFEDDAEREFWSSEWALMRQRASDTVTRRVRR